MHFDRGIPPGLGQALKFMWPGLSFVLCSCASIMSVRGEGASVSGHLSQPSAPKGRLEGCIVCLLPWRLIDSVQFQAVFFASDDAPFSPFIAQFFPHGLRAVVCNPAGGKKKMMQHLTAIPLCAAASSPAQLSLRPSVDARGVFQHKLCALDDYPQDDKDERFALVLVNYKMPRPLLERLWWNATVRVCADGAINRLYRTFEDDETRRKFIPEFIRG